MMLRNGMSFLFGNGEEKLTRADLATCIICVAVVLSALIVFVA